MDSWVQAESGLKSGLTLTSVGLTDSDSDSDPLDSDSDSDSGLMDSDSDSDSDLVDSDSLPDSRVRTHSNTAKYSIKYVLSNRRCPISSNERHVAGWKRLQTLITTSNLVSNRNLKSLWIFEGEVCLFFVCLFLFVCVCLICLGFVSRQSVFESLSVSEVFLGYMVSILALVGSIQLRVREVFHKTVRVCHVHCNFKLGFTCRITVIFGKLKDGSLLINTLASNICFSYRNMFQNGVDALSKIVDPFLSKSSKFYLVQIIRKCSNLASLWHKHLLTSTFHT